MASKISVNLDTSKENYLVAKCKQNDDLRLEVFIYENGLALDLTNKEISIQALKSDGSYIIQSTGITKENNKISVDLSRDFSRVTGTTKIEVVLIESGKQNTTFSFYLEVVASVINGAIESLNTVTILEELSNKVIEAGVAKVETELLIKNGGAATKGDIATVNSHLEQKAEKVYVDNKIGSMGNTKTFKGSCLFSTLPINATVDDYWYVSDKTTNYCWNGTSWIDIGNNLNISNNSIDFKHLDNELKLCLYDSYNFNLKLQSGFVSPTGEFVQTTDGLIVSTDKKLYNENIELIFKGEKEVKYKISYYNSDGTFLKQDDYKTFNKIYIEKGVMVIIQFKHNDETKILDTDFYYTVNYLEKSSNEILPTNIKGDINILKGLKLYLNKNIVDGKSLDENNFENNLVSSSFAFVYEPIIIRNAKGLIYDGLYISKLNNSNARQILFFDYNGKYISTLYGLNGGEIQNNFKIDIPQNAWKIVVIGYINVENYDLYSVNIEKKKLEWLDISNVALERTKASSTSIYYEKANPLGSDFEMLDFYKYPLYPAWGHEYLNGWYNKLYTNKNVVIAVDGDSTTDEGLSLWNGGRRVDMIKKLMCTIGKYPSENITINKNGYGARPTGTYVGEYFNPSFPRDSIDFPNGTLDVTMKQNPDLIVFGYGINDASLTLFPNTTIQERLNQSEAWLEEALKRIRGNAPVNGRPSYNKSADELGIILCTPIQAENGNGRGRDIWQQYQRQIFMKLARKYHCAFYDVSARHYDHKFSGTWSQNNTTTEIKADALHPTPVTNADFMSGIQDLLFPMCLWKW